MLSLFKLINYIMILYKLKSRSSNDTCLDFIIEFGKMASDETGSKGSHKNQLSQNTATAIHHTGNEIVNLC